MQRARIDPSAGHALDVDPIPGLPALAEAVTALRAPEEVTRFLRDLCTLPELEALAHRWQIVLLLEQGVPYVEIARRVPTSTATVTRVAQWLRHGTGGYGIALERLHRRERARR
ncbi:MAG: YerC/YecD family TrpR-related protein [Gaiella sp.]|nr:YerC/YecD family TrpR-related protein [Gaiella sp.]